MLTIKDIDEIEKIVKENIKEEISNLPTKDEFFNKMDEVVSELKTIREEQPIINHKLSDHQDRIEVIEKELQVIPSASS